MTVVARLLTRMVATRFLVILAGISIFVLSLEVVAYSTEILALRSGESGIVARYMLARAPETLSTYLSVSVLLALLLVLTELSHRNEMVALWAAGLSSLRMLIMLLPFALVAGAANFVLSDQAIPLTVPQLRDWGIGDYGKKKLNIGERDPIWMRAGPDILRAASANADSTRLAGVIVFRRDADGLLREQIFAREAELEDGRWRLYEAIVYTRDNLPPSKLETLVYSGAMKPAAAGARSGDPEEISLAELAYFIDNQGFGIRPVWVYETWWHERLSLLFSPLMMIALCLPLASRFRRGGGIGVMFALGVGLGFLYFVGDGISLTMGELGFVRPWMGAWMPAIAFGALAAFLTLRAEKV